tara:strand:+ start:3087 stop:3359 length:273 start_codon:yes stop_codon:yes gene_type:complete
MTAKTVLLNWLQSTAQSSDPWFYSYDLEQQVPTYGRLKHNKVHTASTYARAFRTLRSENTDLLDALGLRLIEIKHNESRAKGWKIEITSK